jgi:hypothetical protein
MKSNRLQRIQEAGRNHSASIQKSLDHRLQVARAKGDENLIRQLEAEQKYFN